MILAASVNLARLSMMAVSHEYYVIFHGPLGEQIAGITDNFLNRLSFVSLGNVVNSSRALSLLIVVGLALIVTVPLKLADLRLPNSR